MKIICTQENIKAGLSTVGRIVSSNNTLPILNNLLLKTKNGLLKISSTNLEIAITTDIRCKIEKEGDITVGGKILIDLINNLPNKNISLEYNDNQLFIETENYHTSIKTLPADEFPLIPEVENGETLNLDAQELKNSLDQVIFAVSTNQTQPEISGVLVAIDKNGLRLVATDRYRLAEKRLKISQTKQLLQEVIIPQKTAVELSRIIGNQKGVIEITFSQTQAAINFNDTQIISRLVDGQYPDYRQIIPSAFSTTTVVEKNALAGALRATAVFSQNNNSVNLDFFSSKQQLVLTAESGQLGKSSVEIPANIDGKDGSMVLNYHYLLDCLNCLTTQNVVIKTIDDGSPGVVLPEDQEDYIYLVMPIKS